MTNEHALGSAIAGGAIAAALIETLFDKRILSLEESRGILDNAMRMAGHYARTPGGIEAGQIIAAMMSGKFTARGGKP